MIHTLLSRVFATKRAQFIRDSHNLETIQKQRLEAIYKNLQITPFYNKLNSSADLLNRPIFSYADFEPWIEKQFTTGAEILCRDIVRFENTSGSTKNRKKIPYSKAFLRELNEASMVWMGDLYCKYPGIKAGPHYWTLSWSPDQDNDDSELFPGLQKFFLQRVLLLNQKIKKAPTLESSWYATLVNLVACRRLSLISVWSPTLLMRINRDIKSLAISIFKTLNNSTWTCHEDELNGLLAVPYYDGKLSLDDLVHFNYRKIWPHLNLISAWDAASSQLYYQELKSQLPEINFQGKGLWATEGVITIPFANKKVLAYKSHYYEFRCIHTGKIHTSWQLQKDQIVEPVITSANGLTRYLIEDRIQVCDYFNQVPCFEFLGRNATSDLVGEKLTDMDFQLLQADILKKFPLKNILFFAVNAKRPFYYALGEVSSPFTESLKKDLEFYIEKSLTAHYNYQLARNLRQLPAVQTHLCTNSVNIMNALAISYQVQGQFKTQSLYRVTEQTFNHLSTFFHSQI